MGHPSLAVYRHPSLELNLYDSAHYRSGLSIKSKPQSHALATICSNLHPYATWCAAAVGRGGIARYPCALPCLTQTNRRIGVM